MDLTLLCSSKEWFEVERIAHLFMPVKHKEPFQVFAQELSMFFVRGTQGLPHFFQPAEDTSAITNVGGLRKVAHP